LVFGIPSAVSSVEFGQETDGFDYCVRRDAPSGGTLFSVWTHIPDDWGNWGHNMDVYVLYGENWHMRCLVANMPESDDPCLYNANSMIFANPYELWAGDYTLDYRSVPRSQAVGWVWVAWQVIVNSNSFTIRQWLKFGIDGAVILTNEDVAPFSELREFLLVYGNNEWAYDNGYEWTQEIADAWTPTDAVSFQVGKDNSYLCHARMDAMSEEPSLEYLDQIARGTAPLNTAWADYELNWRRGKANLSDRSGNGRDLEIESDGTLYEGEISPDF